MPPSATVYCITHRLINQPGQNKHSELNRSALLLLFPAPCTPAKVSANYSCGTSTELSWTESLGRDSFYVLAQTNGHSDSCSTVQTHCSINSLRCGSLYNVSVESISGHCNSSHAARTQLQTGEHFYTQPSFTCANISTLSLMIY